MVDLIFLHMGFLLRFIAVVMSCFYILPRMYQEIKQDNGLTRLRLILLFLGVMVTFATAFSLFFAICMGYINGCHVIGGFGSFISSAGDLSVVGILYIIYLKKY